MRDAPPQIRLSRLTSSRSELLWIRPTGQRVWLYSPTHVLFRDTSLVPWIPVHLQYPQDFRSMAAVAVRILGRQEVPQTVKFGRTSAGKRDQREQLMRTTPRT